MSSSKQQIDEIIGEHAEGLKKESKSESVSDLADRLDQVESLVEELGQTGELRSKIAVYLDDIHSEHDQLMRYRFMTIVFSAVIVAFFVGLLFGLVLDPFQSAREIGNYAEAVLYGGSIGAVVTIVIVVTKGVFRSVEDRHKTQELPENIRTIIDALEVFKN